MKNPAMIFPMRKGNFQLSIIIIFVFTMNLFLPSCGIKTLATRTKAMMGGKLNVEVIVSEDVNQNRPIALDLIVVYDEKLLEQILEMSSKDWFEKKNQIRRDYLKGEGFDSWEWEWVPGQSVPSQRLPLKPKAMSGFIFADYLSKGKHRYRIDPFGGVKIHLSEKDYVVEVLK